MDAYYCFIAFLDVRSREQKMTSASRDRPSASQTYLASRPNTQTKFLQAGHQLRMLLSPELCQVLKKLKHK